MPADEAERSNRAIVRSQLREVIRRAAELSLDDTDTADEQLSEDEVLRIAAELGLPAHHVQRALYELPELRVEPRWYDRYVGSCILSAGRDVASESTLVLRRLADYLVTREYLQIVQRRGDSITFIPADDTLSTLARAFTRSSRRHIITRATRVMVGVYPMAETSHVRVDVDLTRARSEGLRSGTLIGASFGVLTGGAAAVVTMMVLPPQSAGIIPPIAAFSTSVVAMGAAGIVLAARRFKAQVAAAKAELQGLLDRLEEGGRLDPPPSPWRRRLQLRLFGER